MFRRLAHILMCIAMFAVVGGHWTVAQTVAWVEMIWTYSIEAGSLGGGCEKTFGGEAPCEMCRAIARARGKEQKQPAIFKAEKGVGDFLPAERPFSCQPASVAFEYPEPAAACWPKRNIPPPSPVPIEAPQI